MAYHGIASFHGTSGDVSYSALAADADQEVIAINLTDEANVEELMSGAGEPQGFSVRNKRRRITVTCYPKGATLDKAKMALELPDIPSKVTLANFPDTTVASLGLNGDWVYTGGGNIEFSSDGQAKITLPLWATVGGATATTLTAAIS